MFRDDRQLAAACRTLLATARLERPWTDQGPTAEAAELLEADGGPLSSGERVSCWRRGRSGTGRVGSRSPTSSSGSTRIPLPKAA
jgi:hypothetical protein